MDFPTTHSIIRAALDNQQFAFARQTAERWLVEQPDHLSISVCLAEALLEQGDNAGAGRVVRQVLETDPENQAALKLKLRLHENAGDTELVWASMASLRRLVPDDSTIRDKLSQMASQAPAGIGRQLRSKINTDEWYLALIPSLSELEHSWRAGEVEGTQMRAKSLLESHPRLVKAHLLLADCLMAQGDEAAAVDHIHQAAAFDPGGEVAQRIWDGKRPYVGAWPAASVLGATGPLPHPVASALGWNLLPEPEAPTIIDDPPNGRSVAPSEPAKKEVAPAKETSLPPPLTLAQETLINIQTEINRLSGRSDEDVAPTPVGQDRVRLQPIYVMVTSKGRLEEKYGVDGWQQIDGALQAVAKAAEARLRAPAGALYIDDAQSLASFQLEPVDPSDPWAVKTLIDQLEGRLEDQDKEIGWLQLVGGPDVIPFHRLPNPTDDGDVEVLSDNPYGCRDENYFLPQRAVGRLPDGADNDPTVLLRSLSTALAAHHAARRAQGGWLSRLLASLIWVMRRRPASTASFGYTASVWRKASLAVFSKIGSTRGLRISPPMTAAEFNSLALGPSSYAYFNLHGIADGPAWYGQRDPTFPADFPDFPVALRPEDVGAQGSVPEVVFTEACYGALVEAKTAQTTLSLKFLAAGSQMVVGSTCIAYGGLNSSLEAADLLASFFWQELMAGRSGGRALQQAKVNFAQYLDARQGYLDGEDQKTLISFVYYGDSSLSVPPTPRAVMAPSKAKKTWKEMTTTPLTVCAKRSAEDEPTTVSPELVEKVRARVSGYLPGMEKATLAVARQRAFKGTDWRSGAKAATPTDRMVFTLQKTAQVSGETHEQVVKVTVDEAGQMLKLAVSK